MSVYFFDRRLKGDPELKYRTSVDGINWRTFKPEPFSAKWFSDKLRGPGVRYEIALAIITGDIVRVIRIYPCGSYAGVTIFRMEMRKKILTGERVIADRRYKDERYCYS